MMLTKWRLLVWILLSLAIYHSVVAWSSTLVSTSITITTEKKRGFGLVTRQLETCCRLQFSPSRQPIQRIKQALLLQSKLDPEDADDVDTETEKGKEEEEDQASSSRRVMRSLLLNINLAFGYLIIALGALLTIGLVLNLFGYGYQFTPEGQLRIDTIQQFREENQFRVEVQKSMKEYRMQQQEKELLLPKSTASPLLNE